MEPIFLNDANVLICKTETDLQVPKQLMVTKGETWWGGINQEFRINIYTHYYI